MANIDEGILRELGARLGAARLERNRTQAALTEQAGASKRTVERLDSGEVATRLSGFLRVCRALGLVERFETLVSESVAGPMAKLKLQGRKRQRASGRKGADPGPSRWRMGATMPLSERVKCVPRAGAERISRPTGSAGGFAAGQVRQHADQCVACDAGTHAGERVIAARSSTPLGLASAAQRSIATSGLLSENAPCLITSLA